MWPNNNDGQPFAGSGPFQNEFNQDDFSPSPFGNGATTPLGGQPIFNQLPFDTSNGEAFQNGYTPDLSMFNNQTAFQQNQFMRPLPFSPPFIPQNLPQNQTQAPPTPDSSRRTPQLDAKTAELKERLIKARLMKSRGVQSSSTPPQLNNNTSAIVSPLPLAASILLNEYPAVPTTAAGNREEDLNALISEFSTPNVAEKTAGSTTENNVSSSIPIPLLTALPAAESPAPSLGYPAKDTTTVGNSYTNGNHLVSSTNGNGNDSRKSSISEGEILEDSPVSIEQTLNQSENSLPLHKAVNKVEQLSQRARDQSPMPTPTRGPMQDIPSSPRRTLPTQPRSHRSHDERRDEPSTRYNKDRDNRRPYDSAYRTDRNMNDESDRDFTSRRENPLYEAERKSEVNPPHSETERDSYRRRSSRDEEARKSEPAPEPKGVPKRREPFEERREELRREQPRADLREEPRREPNVQAQAIPAQVPSLEVDVRDWLEFTGFHDKEYRIGVLDRRRRLKILDEERKLILGEIETEEMPMRVQPPSRSFSSMLPPPTPTKPADKTETGSIGAQAPPNGPASQESSNKRSHSYITGSPTGAKVKVARTDDGGISGSRINGEEDSERNLPRPGGYGSSRRSSFDHRDYEENSRHDGDRTTRGRDRSREQEHSPRRTGSESGQADRSRQYDDDRGDDRPNAGARRGYHEPDFHRNRGSGSRGRGVHRGRGRGWHDDNRGPGPSSKTGGKPFKDPKGFRGGKSGQ